MDAAVTGQVSTSAADVYQEFFVPALFAEWAEPVSAAAGVSHGQMVLDVACGTGVLAREAWQRAQPGGVVVGLDCNDGMLAVARREAPQIDWRLGQAESLPAPDASFDAVVSQFGLMFFEDRNAALREMWRVLRPGGRLAVVVWDQLESVAGYAAMTALLQRLFGDSVTAACEAPFILGDRNELATVFAQAGIGEAEIETQAGVVRFPSIEAWVYTDVRGWTLADSIDEAQYQTLLKEASSEMRRFQRDDGSVAFASSAHIVTARKV